MHASPGKVLSQRIAGNPEEEVLLARLRSNHEQMKRLFDVLSQRQEESAPAAELVHHETRYLQRAGGSREVAR